MPRTRKHKYGRKLIHKKRTASRNKIKRKTKIKSKKIKQKFKKSHMRYTKNGMKHRIQRGGGRIHEEVTNLLTVYTSDDQTRDSIYESTLNALNILKLPREQRDIEYFKDIINARRLFGLEDDTSQFLSLTEVLTIPKLDFRSEIAFLLRKDLGLEIKFTRQNWIDFITHAHTVIHRERPFIDADDIRLFKLKVENFKSRLKNAQDRRDKKQEDIYAELIAEYTTIIIANKDALEESYDTRTFRKFAPRPVEHSPVVYEVKDYISRDGYQNIGGVDKVLLSETQFEYPVKEYLRYRLSNDRTGARDNKPDNIKRFNQKIVFISRILDNIYKTKQGVVRPTGIKGYNDATEGKKLFLLLRWLNLIPVVGEGAGEYGKYDSVPDGNCLVSAISGSEFTTFKKRSHCRTCGRCIHKDETTREEEECIECYELFNSSSERDLLSSRGPGGAVLSQQISQSPLRPSAVEASLIPSTIPSTGPSAVEASLIPSTIPSTRPSVVEASLIPSTIPSTRPSTRPSAVEASSLILPTPPTPSQQSKQPIQGAVAHGRSKSPDKPSMFLLAREKVDQALATDIERRLAKVFGKVDGETQKMIRESPQCLKNYILFRLEGEGITKEIIRKLHTELNGGTGSQLRSLLVKHNLFPIPESLWVPDGVCERSAIPHDGGEKFGVFTRRHHCRCCGRCITAKYYVNTSKVCTECDRILTRM